MEKPNSLRDTLTKALPTVKKDPQKLAIFITGGRVMHTGTDALSFEYAYTLRLLLLDYAGHADAVMAPVVGWMKRNQPEVFDNPERRARAIRFEAEYLNAKAIDLQIELELTEAVLARPRPGGPTGALNLIHKNEPPPPLAILQAEHWEVYLRDEKLAEWDYAPR
ncbi:phage tail protein [Acidovorax radicis]|uniref:phage tail protein n=1 Tax=Acidovorax radicis TaxID=758826 RepID=UPI0002376DF1|nr:phage tail protein [Acidovorax radicis]